MWFSDIFFMYESLIYKKIKTKEKYAKHNVIKPPAVGSNKLLQLTKDNLQHCGCYFSGRINFDERQTMTF